jgi:DNA-binding NtrC family response regulator
LVVERTPETILVVEDESSLREPLEHLLRLRDYDVVSADSVDSALEALQSRKPAAAIVDLQLKGGSGRDVIVRMPERAPVIIFSGMRSASGELERLRPRTRLVEKPASLTWLIDELDHMLDKSRRVCHASLAPRPRA